MRTATRIFNGRPLFKEPSATIAVGSNRNFTLKILLEMAVTVLVIPITLLYNVS